MASSRHLGFKGIKRGDMRYGSVVNMYGLAGLEYKHGTEQSGAVGLERRGRGQGGEAKRPSTF